MKLIRKTAAEELIKLLEDDKVTLVSRVGEYTIKTFAHHNETDVPELYSNPTNFETQIWHGKDCQTYHRHYEVETAVLRHCGLVEDYEG